MRRVVLLVVRARSSVWIECGVPDPEVMGSNPVALVHRNPLDLLEPCFAWLTHGKDLEQ
jgi:hypothetical protein